MIKSIFFDFYNTLVKFWPPVEEIQEASCQELGLKVSKTDIRRGYALADEYFNEANAEKPLALRTPEERSEFFANYERLILRGAGLDVTPRLAAQIWEMVSLVQKDLVLFDDVIPALRALSERRLTLGILSNIRRDLNDLSRKLGLEPYLSFCITSAEAGAEKPDPPIFLAAINRAGVEPEEAVYVGDQYKADVQGAKAVGMLGVLIDREGMHQGMNDCSKIGSLLELEQVLAPLDARPAP